MTCACVVNGNCTCTQIAECEECFHLFSGPSGLDPSVQTTGEKGSGTDVRTPERSANGREANSDGSPSGAKLQRVTAGETAMSVPKGSDVKRSKGGDSTEALKAIWMEGYREGFRRGHGGVPVVQIDSADIARVYEPGTCAHPRECPCSEAIEEMKKAKPGER